MKKLSFGAMSAMVLTLLGMEKVTKDEKNKVVLSKEEKEKISTAFGEAFMNKWIAIEESDEKASEEQTQELYAEMKNHFAAEFEAQLKVEKAKAENLLAEKTKLEKDLSEKQKELESKNKALELLSAETEDKPKAETTDTGFFGKKQKYAKGSTIMRVNISASHYAAIMNASRRGFPVLASGADIDTEDLKREFGAYLGQNGNYIQIDLYNQLLSGFSSADEFKTQLAENEYRASEALMTSVMQSFIPEWTPQGTAQFNPIRIKNFRHKINVAIKPATVLDSYLSFLYEEGLTPDQHPIVKFVIDNLIFPTLLRDIENRAFFKGKFVETVVSNGVVTQGGKPEDSMDGIETILVENKANTDSGIHYMENAKTLAELKALSAADMLQYVSNFVDFMSDFYSIEKVYCSSQVYKLYKNAYKQVYGIGAAIADPNFGSDTIDYSEKILTPLKGMYNSPILFATPADNMLKLKWKKEAPFIINDVQKDKYDVLILGEFCLSGGFAVGNALFAAVPEGYNPKAVISSVWGESNNYQSPKSTEKGVISLKSTEGSNIQAVGVGETIENIIYKFKGASASLGWSSTTPAGVTVEIEDNTVTISGAPTAAAVYNYTLTVTGYGGGESTTATGKITATAGA
ncbi:MAG: hypothetical protein LBS50_06925 [Prevotellaceae bacterium]|jgi:hypothetical protein|nr:hypothetical protein [Prevotellaceae bacterium]